MFESRISAGATAKLPRWWKTSRKDGCAVVRHGRTCWKMRRDILRIGKQKDRAVIRSLKSLIGWSPRQEGTWISWRSWIGWPDILWSVNKLARSVTKCTGACDRRLARLISYIHHTSDYWQYCHTGNTVQHCRMGLLQDSDFCWRPGLKINFGRNFMYLWKSNICS